MSKSMEQIVALCKRRGFIFQSSEIYGGIQGFWDYGPLGTELKRNVRDAWYQRHGDHARRHLHPPRCPPAPFHGRSRNLDHHAPAGVEVQRPLRPLCRHDAVLPPVPQTLPRRPRLGHAARVALGGILRSSSTSIWMTCSPTRPWANPSTPSTPYNGPKNRRQGQRLAPGLALVRHPDKLQEMVASQCDVPTKIPHVHGDRERGRDRPLPALPGLRWRPHRSTAVQLDVRDAYRCATKRRQQSLLAPGNGPGDVRQFQKRAR